MHGSQMIYATRLSSPSGKYTPRSLAFLAACALFMAGSATAPAAQPGPLWREAPEYLQAFAPAGPRRASYRAFVSPADIDTALKQLDLGGSGTASGWTPTPAAPADAFGQAGTYDRFVVARLYGSTRPRVARGVTLADGQRELWTLISPYPDATLQRLQNGTLLLVLRYDPADLLR